MTAVVITQARTTSTRLPGKVLLEAAGRTMLDHHLDRLAAADLDVIVATTTNRTDDPIVEIAERRGLRFWRGDEHDVLDRFAGAAREFDLDTIVRVTSDCPLIDGQVVRTGITTFEELADPWAYVSNGIERTFPRGLDFEVFSAQALLDANDHAVEPAHREHVTPYLYTNGSGRVHVHHVLSPVDGSAYRITLDTPEDYQLIRTLIEDHGAAGLAAAELISLLQRNHELTRLNEDVPQKSL